MSYPINYPTPQGANIQIFNVNYSGTGGTQVWVKPQGASFVWFTLIGAGGGGDGSSTGGGSGAVTNCMVPAFLIPDELRVTVGTGGPVSPTPAGAGLSTFIAYQQKIGSEYTLLTANPGNYAGGNGAASANNYFSAMGIYQSVAGETGGVTGLSASIKTFLSGGLQSGVLNSNYGYSLPSGTAGYFVMQPIIVGVGGADTGKGGIGCGGGLNGKGGDGLAIIITW
jgi:hypothetical protein